MLAKKCDRCGKFYESAAEEIDGKMINAVATVKRTAFSADPERIYDLCEECLSEFKAWIENKRDIEEDIDPYEIPLYPKVQEVDEEE